MDRELLIEIGCEEIPAGWLPGLTAQMAKHLTARLADTRLVHAAAVEAFSTPRRLTARVSGLAERQTDKEELVMGPPVSAAFNAAGQPTPAAIGFAKKNNVDVAALLREETPKGAYLACRLQQRGKATVDVLGDVMAGLLRDFSFPKQMRWDAYLEDGKGDLVFARPIRWLVLLYGGRVVPFVIRRTEHAQGPQVQDVASGANTYGHRFQTTSGRAGRAIKVKTFEDYEKRLLENFVILDRREREQRVKRELESHARRLGGRVSHAVAAQSSLLQEVPDLVEYPCVVAGHYPPEFLKLPEEVLTTTMIHHQHYFPVVDDAGALKPAFLAVTNIESEKPEVVARNSERVLVARLRDAQFFWEEDSKATLESRIERLSTILFHKKLGSYKEKAERIAVLAGWIAADVFGRPDQADAARTAGRLAKADLGTDMVRELTELQGTMGGIYARQEGMPEAVWKAIYHHYLPIGVDAAAAPSAADLGPAAVTWAAVALADKLDSVVGMLAAGERPTGSRDPLGLRRQAQGAVKILADLHEVTGISARVTLGQLVAKAGEPWTLDADAHDAIQAFLVERVLHLFEQRGFDIRNARAVAVRSLDALDVARAKRTLAVLAEFAAQPEFRLLAEAVKRVKNISKGVVFTRGWDALQAYVPAAADAAERDLIGYVASRVSVIDEAERTGQYLAALKDIAGLQPFVAKYFDDVMVMAEDAAVRDTRLQVMAGLRDLVVRIADISEIVAE
ncbi:MAG: glycine--tRNA ligase subunit beta [Vicinamibacterales bacterium]